MSNVLARRKKGRVWWGNLRQTTLDSSGSGEVYVVVEGSCKHGNEPSGSIKHVTLMTL